MVQLVIRPAKIAASTAERFSVGSVPGNPMQIGQQAELGGAPNVVGQEQNSLVLVFNSAWTSSPITIS